MKQALTRMAKEVLKRSHLALMPYDRYTYLKEVSRAVPAIDLIAALPSHQSAMLVNLWRESRAQLFQDLFVLSQLDFKREGFFVEFGATDGVSLSNSYLLETRFGWEGILAEPCRAWHARLRQNRKCNVETACVWTESGQNIVFNSATEGEYSTIASFSDSDLHASIRRRGHKYTVDTISLVDLLKKYNAPKIVDYLSIDTEGSEYDILRSFDFDLYQIRVITCEHNSTPQREKIHSLLKAKGYMRKLEALSAFDDWYVLAG